MKSYDDPIKRRAREILAVFISNTLRDKDARKARVLCFPGAEQDGEEALEVKEVYDKLGIPRENVVGLEMDPARYRRLVAANLGIKVVNSRDIEYFQRGIGQIGRFDIISLDYTSFFNTDRMYALDLIAGEQLLRDQAVLCTNYMGAREDPYTKGVMKLCAQSVKNPFTLEDAVDDYRALVEKRAATETDLTSRSDVIKSFVTTALYAGKAALDYRMCTEIFTDTATYDNDLLKEMIERGIDDIDKFAGRTLHEQLSRRSDYRESVMTIALKGLKAAGLTSSQMMLYFYMKSRPYNVVQSESFKYVSNSGTPMFLDMFFVDKFNDHFRQLPPMFSIDKHRGTIKVYPGCLKPSEKRKYDDKGEYLTKLINACFAYVNFHSPPRKFLGSSCERKERISKENAISLLQDGVSPKEIAETYAGFSVGQLAAFKAHVTMGTYKAIGE